MSPSHHFAALPARLLTPDEAEERLRARQPWADLWRRRVRDTERAVRAETLAAVSAEDEAAQRAKEGPQ